jgi:hypothetical protein
MTSEELDALDDAVWRYEAAGGGKDHRLSALRAWPYPKSRGVLHVELLRSDLGRCVGDAGWPDTLASAVLELADRAAAVTLCRGAYKDACETNLPLAWNDFAPVPADPEELALRLDGDPLVLGAVVQGRYAVEQRIGSGGFGVVYRANDSDTGRKLAIKGPLGVGDRRRQAVRLLQREAEILRAIGGAGAPALFGIVTADDDLQLVLMEYVEGVSLTTWQRTHKPTPHQSALLIGALAATTDNFHRAGFVHRDLKPDNILVRLDGTPCLVDLGVTFTEADRFTTEGRVPGTLNYMPPEGLLGMSSQLDGRSDVWALGAILYELLTGDLLQQIDSREAALVASVAIHVDKPDFPDDVPDALREICLRCLAREPNERFSSAGELAAALSRWESGADATQEEASQQRLLGWRLGMKYGSTLENLAYLGRHLHLMGDALGTIAAAEPKALEHFGMARGFGMGLVIAYDDLTKLALKASIALPRLDVSRRLQEIMYRNDKSPGTAAWLRAELPRLRGHLEAIYPELIEGLRHVSDAASACCELAARTMVLLLSQEDYVELDEVWRRTGIDGDEWERFKETFERGPTAKEALARLDKDIERRLVFGEPAEFDGVGFADLFTA